MTKRTFMLVTLLVVSSFSFAVYSLHGTGLAQDETTPTPATEPTEEPIEIVDVESLIAALTEAGFTVEIVEERTEEEFFSINATVISVNGENVMVYTHADAETALAESELIDMNGYMVGEAMIEWIATPHFYLHENLLALYVGEDVQVAAWLTRLLGHEIAGNYAALELTDVDALVEFFTAYEIEAENPAETITQAFFSVEGQLLTVMGETVELFFFEDEEIATAEAAQIGPDGASTPTMMITWIADPHFYQRENVIALYVGENAELHDYLTNIFGKQFAGAEEKPIEATDSTADVSDVPSLVAALEATGVEVVDTGEPIIQDFFLVDGQLLNVAGEDVQVFVYDDEANATSEASQIGPDGSPMTMMITWVSTPHFYQSGNVVVLYVGTNPDVLTALESVLGAQFAGGE